MSVDAVIFDFGGVFVDSPFTAVNGAARSLGVDPVVLLDVVFGSYELDTDHPWHRLERGEITLDVARERIAEASVAAGGPPIDPVEVLMALAGGGIRDSMVDYCRAVRARGLRTGLLTNNAAEFGPFWRPLLPLDELFDDVVDSCEVGCRKPDPQIFHLALSRLGVEPARAVFIDDAPGNVEGARRAGLHAVLIGPDPTDVPAALDEMARLIG